MNLRLTNPNIDIIRVANKDGNLVDRIVIRGLIDPDTIDAIQVDSYQREIITGAKVLALMDALETSVLPGIELGLRGSKYQTRENDTVFILQDPVFVIDGAQRINAVRELVKKKPDAKPRISALVHVDSDFDWERERFRILNQERSKISPNVLLRNASHDHPGINLIYSMSVYGDKFILREKVSWNQRMGRNELLTALRVCMAINVLHGRFNGGGGTDEVRDLTKSLDKKFVALGEKVMRDNVSSFFALIDECWNIHDIKYRDRQPQLKGTFLEVFAGFLSDHDIFWNGNRLMVRSQHKGKLKKFSINDPEISRLCGAGGSAKSILEAILLKHFNSGRRGGRLGSDGEEDDEGGSRD